MPEAVLTGSVHAVSLVEIKGELGVRLSVGHGGGLGYFLKKKKVKEKLSEWSGLGFDLEAPKIFRQD